ncbi:MAG TPA: glycoside hydrolase family 92 protein, partial [Ferruginibacter sp.]|nr:glycoside hydrolase family 92 protein [Ferruginibacter sp.]
YPVNPANGVYVFGSPAVSSATIHLPGNKIFTLKTINNTKANVYIQSVTYNGKPYTKSWFTHAMLMNGGEFILTMG